MDYILHSWHYKLHVLVCCWEVTQGERKPELYKRSHGPVHLKDCVFIDSSEEGILNTHSLGHKLSKVTHRIFTFNNDWQFKRQFAEGSLHLSFSINRAGLDQTDSEIWGLLSLWYWASSPPRTEQTLETSMWSEGPDAEIGLWRWAPGGSVLANPCLFDRA